MNNRKGAGSAAISQWMEGTLDWKTFDYFCCQQTVGYFVQSTTLSSKTTKKWALVEVCWARHQEGFVDELLLVQHNQQIHYISTQLREWTGFAKKVETKWQKSHWQNFGKILYISVFMKWWKVYNSYTNNRKDVFINCHNIYIYIIQFNIKSSNKNQKEFHPACQHTVWSLVESSWRW
jgi:hypothetical protein